MRRARTSSIRPSVTGSVVPERPAGFSLIETLVALSLLGVAMLLTLSLIFQEPRTLRRLEAHEQAFGALEAGLEAVRAGMPVPVGGSAVDLAALHQPEERIAEDLAVWADREPVSGSGLHRVRLTARYQVGGRRYHRSLETLVWTP